jgi:hypothetical protein
VGDTPLLLGRILEEGANARQLAGSRRGTETLGAPLGKECPQVGRLEPLQRGRTDLLALISSEKVDESVRRRNVSADGVGRAAPVVLEMAGPASGKLAGCVMR